ncbi:MAG: hypothetical protein U0930_14775 [Pirellulales bacterium]
MVGHHKRSFLRDSHPSSEVAQTSFEYLLVEGIFARRGKKGDSCHADGTLRFPVQKRSGVAAEAFANAYTSGDVYAFVFLASSGYEAIVFAYGQDLNCKEEKH